MNPEPTASTSPLHERGAADHDQPYTWARTPDTYLSTREIARLMLIRARLAERNALHDHN